ncbi:hypothetical protein VP01_2281g2 [Puccinia sorghi]|uniref:Uncharacterized protein n=1 Tax=Puccinia sorghi TaxID=27349 RepID=A0A0L6VA03_9BASI|nr:hypothetical protein VP01_2281g2 [Puccinia sorghi]
MLSPIYKKPKVPTIPTNTSAFSKHGEIISRRICQPRKKTKKLRDLQTREQKPIEPSLLFSPTHSQKENPHKRHKKSSSDSTQSAAIKASHQKSLEHIESHHKFFPFLLYLLGGVQGIFISTQDHQSHSIRECLDLVKPFVKYSHLFVIFLMMFPNIQIPEMTLSKTAIFTQVSELQKSVVLVFIITHLYNKHGVIIFIAHK